MGRENARNSNGNPNGQGNGNGHSNQVSVDDADAVVAGNSKSNWLYQFFDESGALFDGYYTILSANNERIKKLGPNESLEFIAEVPEEPEDSETPEETPDDPTDTEGIPEVGADESEAVEEEPADETEVVISNGYVHLMKSNPFGSDVQVFEDTDGDGSYSFVGSQWIGSDTPPTDNPIPALAKDLKYIGGDEDDEILVTVETPSEGGEGADSFNITDGGELTITDFDSDEGDTLVFDTGFGLLKEQLFEYISNITVEGDTLIVTFGTEDWTYAEITLVGAAGNIGVEDVDVIG